MNCVTFSDPFVSFFEHCNISGDILKSPLIEWDSKRLEVPLSDRQLLRNEDGSLRLPFKEFRVFGKLEFGRSEPFKLVVFQNPAHKDFTMVLMTDGKDKGNGIVGCSIKHLSEGKTSLGSNEIKVFSFFEGKTKFFTPDEPDPYVRNWAEICGRTAKNDLDLIAADFMNPHLYMCKKCPPIPQGKTILWQKAREHYVLIHKAHAANNRESIGKRIIQDGPLIDRAAHSRRAHFRLLRSPKFRHKQGQRIWVQSAWVGPKEWTDRSGQIYRIVENRNLAC